MDDELEALARIINPQAWIYALPWLPGAQMREQAKARKKASHILAAGFSRQPAQTDERTAENG